MGAERLQAIYADLQAEATRLAGGLEDIPRRAMLLHHLYLDSGGNHAFAQVAAHGALWAAGYFEVGGRLGRLIAYRYFYNSQERAFRLGLLQSFAEGFRKVNRQVCIDTWTNYHFAKVRGEAPGAEELIRPSLLEALNRVHAARRANATLSPREKFGVFRQSFRWEQEVTVAPGVQQAVAGFECKIMKTLCLKPVVRFAYFPVWQYLLFRDFSDREERIEQGMRAFDLARRRGWGRVEKAMLAYGVLPRDYLERPREYYGRVLEKTVGAGRSASGGFPTHLQ
jgi:hypothetical protein